MTWLTFCSFCELQAPRTSLQSTLPVITCFHTCDSTSSCPPSQSQFLQSSFFRSEFNHLISFPNQLGCPRVPTQALIAPWASLPQCSSHLQFSTCCVIIQLMSTACSTMKQFPHQHLTGTYLAQYLKFRRHSSNS